MLAGIMTVARWDIKQRLRSSKLLAAWLVWVAILTLITLGIVTIAYRGSQYDPDPSQWGVYSGPTIFGFTVLLVLALSFVIVPVFSASAIVAERESATLATLQATPLGPGQIVGGKLVAAAVVAALFLGGSLPAFGIAVGVGHISWWRALVCLLVVYFEMVFVCAVALGWSSIVARSLVSTVLTYLTVFILTIGSLILVAMMGLLVTTEDYEHTWAPSAQQKDAYAAKLDDYYTAHPVPDGSHPPAPPLDQCSWQVSDYPYSHSHMERVWWVLLANPFALVSDAAPLPADAKGDIQAYMQDSSFDPLAGIALLTRTARLGDPSTYYDCYTGTTAIGDYGDFYVTANQDGTFDIERGYYFGDKRVTDPVTRPTSPIGQNPISMSTPIWPIGLAVHLVIAALFFWLAVRRVAVPYGQLPKGQRVA